ncbi:EGLN1 [Symbiodinium pilosum]|uniref:EGLN1 protein n=1 Tax=Symbiodinium pilosum TaxID=2952 RepID=A0A812Y887_SYMPI|nr:EGLN1 [Symbiodinium pilosum]
MIQVLYDASCAECLRAIQLVSYREETLRMAGQAPTVQLHAWPQGERVLQGLSSSKRPTSLSRKVWALLPSGLVLGQCQEDPMRLIYEMELLALVRLPTPQIRQRVDSVAVLPLLMAKQHSKAGSGRWWRQAEVFRLTAAALQKEHLAVLDDFLPEETCHALLLGAQASRGEMVRGATGAAGKALTKGTEELQKVLNEPSRGDVVKFSDDGNMPGCRGFLEALDTLVEGLQGCQAVADRLQHVDWANGAMFAIYPGDSARYIKHVDNTLGTDGRRLTAVLYLNKDWRPADGGCLRVFEPTMQSCQVKRDVEPLWNRLVVFWSTQEVPHEVLSSFKDRLAVSVWFICGRESLRNEESFQRLFNPQKLRCIAQRDRRSCLMQAAETEEERLWCSQCKAPSHRQSAVLFDSESLESTDHPCSCSQRSDAQATFTPAKLSILARRFRWRREEEPTWYIDVAIRAAVEKALTGQHPATAFAATVPSRPKPVLLPTNSVTRAKPVVPEPSLTAARMPRHFELVEDDDDDNSNSAPLRHPASPPADMDAGCRIPISFGIVD